MRIAAADDEARQRENIQDYLSQFAAETGIKIQLSLFPSGDALLSGYCCIYDIVILDIGMPGTNGMDTARKIRELDPDVLIVFVTNLPQYALSGYEVNAVDYILKPVSYADFKKKFRRVVEIANRRQKRRVILESSEGIRQVPLSDICFVESIGHYLLFHIGAGIYKVRENMKECESNLQLYGFCRIHKSYLVNLAHIDEIRTDSLILHGQVLPVGRSYKDDLVRAFFQYIQG